MKLHNSKTGVMFETLTTKNGGSYISIVRRIDGECNYMTSREIHPTRGKARHYSQTIAKYQFAKHSACYGM